MITLPFSVIGTFWFFYLQGYNLSVAIDVGFIALSDITAEFGVVLLIHLNMAIKQYEEQGELNRLKI